MKALKVGMCALAVVALESGFAAAAWNSVFQATLTSRPSTPAARSPFMLATATPALRNAPATLTCDSCGKSTQQCTTRYVQRTCYQPVTTYQSKSYYQQVTSYQTSYYYEPVTTYRYTCAYDPCTCSYQQVATPCTSYQLRSQCCPVTSWVQRCCYEPVTTYQQSCYYEPITTCCQTTVGAPVTSVPQQQQPYAAPVITEQRSAAPPVVQEQRSAPAVVDVPPASPMPEAYGTGRSYPNTTNKQPQRTWEPKQPATQPPAPPVRLDRIVVGPKAQVEGQVVRSDRTPRPNSVVTFVSVNNGGAAQRITTNYAGRFNVTLPSGGWLVYLQNPDGTRQYHNRIDVNGQSAPQIRLVSR